MHPFITVSDNKLPVITKALIQALPRNPAPWRFINLQKQTSLCNSNLNNELHGELRFDGVTYVNISKYFVAFLASGAGVFIYKSVSDLHVIIVQPRDTNLIGRTAF